MKPSNEVNWCESKPRNVVGWNDVKPRDDLTWFGAESCPVVM